MRQVADLHCDALSKLAEDPALDFAGQADGKLDVTFDRMQQGNVTLQAFAIWLSQVLPKTPETLLRYAEKFQSGIVAKPGMRHIQYAEDVEEARRAGQSGAILSLEGADALRGEWWVLRLLVSLGLRLLGPTWNPANWACDGSGESRGAGLTQAGRQLIAECESLGVIVDVSHLSDRGFWEVADMATKPFFASHSNARALCNHPRNLTDEQIRTIIQAKGIIGVTFVPFFLTKSGPATIEDVLRHVEHICSLGGQEHLAFGSDFDGIDVHVEGLAHPGNYPSLAEALIKRYPEHLVEGWLGGHVRRFLRTNLPLRPLTR